MSKRMSLIVLTMLACALSWAGMRKAVSQQEAKQGLGIIYPNAGIIITGSGTRYGGIIYVSVYAESPDLAKKLGAGPVATSELNPSQRSAWQLPLGTYEVRYGMRTGSEMKTFIVRDVILRPEMGALLTVEMNADAKTTIIGGDMSIQQMEDALRQGGKDIADLQQEVAKLKK